MKRIIFFLLIVLISCSKTSTHPLNEMEKREITVSVSTMLNRYFDNISNKGLMAEFAYLDSTSDFFWVPPGYTEAIRYDSVKTCIQINAAKFNSIKNTWTTLHVQPLSMDLASYTGNIHSAMIDTSGNKMEINLIETGIVIKRNSGWKLLSGQTTLLN